MEFKVFLLIAFSLFVASCAKEKDKMDTLEISSMWNADEPQAEWLRLMADEFGEENGITVKVDFSGREVVTKVRSRLAVKDVPDIIEQDFDQLFAAFLSEDKTLFLPLDDMFAMENQAGEGPVGSLYDKGFLSHYMKEGSQYLFPNYFVTSGFFYNKIFFEENNFSIPVTWDELIALGKSIKELGVAPMALDGGVNFYNFYYFGTMAERLLGPGALARAGSDKTGESWKKPEWLEVAQKTSQLSAAGLNFFQSNYQGSSWPAAQKDWANKGTAALIYVGSWIAVETQEYASPGFEYGYFPFPSIEGGVGSNRDMTGRLFGYAVMKDAKNSEAAKDFLRYISTKENSNLYVEMTDTMSARKETDFPGVLKAIKPYLENVNQGFIEFDSLPRLYPQWIESVMYPLNDALIFGEISAEEFIEQLAGETKAFYDNVSN